jgi:hypothetical protein
MKRFLTMGAIALLGLAACNQQSTPKSNVVGTLEVTFSSNPSENKAVLRPLASTPQADSAITINPLTDIATSFGTNGTFNYVRALVTVKANQAFNNLTFYAYNKTGNVGGTAIKNLVNFVGGSAADATNAQSLLPVHARDASGAYIADTQDFQAFSSSDLTPVQAFVPGETVLQYGFVARKNATTRAFAATDTGTINLAYKIPVATGTNTYKFTATFVVADETVSRVTRDIDETAAQADARAAALMPAATEVMLIGVDTQGTATRSGGKRFSNIKIGTSTNLLPDPALAVYRIGSGTGTLVSSGNPVFIDKFNTTGSSQTASSFVAMPTAASGANKPLIASGTSSTEGLLALAENGKCLLVTGYGTTVGGTSLSGTTSAAVNRVVGIVDSLGSVDTTTALSDFSSGNNIRSAVSADCSSVWVSGASGGVAFASKGSTTSIQIAALAAATPTNVAITNLRQLGIFSGQLFTSTASGSVRLGTVDIGLPTTSGKVITNLTGFPTTGSQYGFFFADLDNTVAGLDTLYFVDDTLSTTGIYKFSLVGGTWTANSFVGAANEAYRGLTGIVNGTTVTLFATRKGGSSSTGGGELVSLTDSSGYAATLTGTPILLATAATSTAFRGVALQPR